MLWTDINNPTTHYSWFVSSILAKDDWTIECTSTSSKYVASVWN